MVWVCQVSSNCRASMPAIILRFQYEALWVTRPVRMVSTCQAETGPGGLSQGRVVFR